MNKIKPRMPRVDRNDEYHIEDDSHHMWVVSYADFLMVLLSFFILFFSTEEKDELIQKIIRSADTGGSTSDVQSGMSGSGASTAKPGIDPKNAKRAVASIPDDAMKNLLENFDFKTDKSERRIVFMFPDNIYRLGQIDLAESQKMQLSELMKNLNQYSDYIEIEFVGHTDSSPLVNNRTQVLNDNFALSVIRATRALQYVQGLGFPSEKMAAKGSAEMKRNTRSLSLIIKPIRSEI